MPQFLRGKNLLSLWNLLISGNSGWTGIVSKACLLLRGTVKVVCHILPHCLVIWLYFRSEIQVMNECLLPSPSLNQTPHGRQWVERQGFGTNKSDFLQKASKVRRWQTSGLKNHLNSRENSSFFYVREGVIRRSVRSESDRWSQTSACQQRPKEVCENTLFLVRWLWLRWVWSLWSCRTQ